MGEATGDDAASRIGLAVVVGLVVLCLAGAALFAYVLGQTCGSRADSSPNEDQQDCEQSDCKFLVVAGEAPVP